MHCRSMGRIESSHVFLKMKSPLWGSPAVTGKNAHSSLHFSSKRQHQRGVSCNALAGKLMRSRSRMTGKTSNRGTWVLVVIMGIGLLITLRYLGVKSESYDGSMDQDICKFSYKSLPSKVWSHRAHFGHDTVDGSRSAVKGLLDSGVLNFDVDVSCRKREDASSCDFVVAHPSLVTAQVASIQPVSSFLEQIYEYAKKSKKETLVPTITLEMKLTAPQDQIDFVRTVQQLPLAGRVAIIGADPQTLAAVVPYIKQGGIAAAYRSLPLTDHDYNWPKASDSKGSSPEPAVSGPNSLSTGTILAPLVAESPPDSQNARVSAGTVSPAVKIAADTQTLYLDRASSEHSGDKRSLLQVYMPDAKLVRAPIVFAEVSL
jgi:hypothetical protein